MSLPVFPCRTNLKLHNISLTPKMVREVIRNLDLSEASGPDFIPVILAELFNMCLKEYFFTDFWKVSSVVSVCKNADQLKIL